jgi:hypothetical protein
MPLSGNVLHADDGALGFDFNADGQALTPALARAFHDAGYRFCLRYVPREAAAGTLGFDLKAAEARLLLDSGFGVMAVQHFKSEKGWTPDPGLGKRYGEFAARWAAEKVGLPGGVCVFLDLEAVKDGTPKADILGYCTEWHQAVTRAGYAPGLYLGDRARLSSNEVADKLPFEHHWVAFNETFDIPGRGFQLKQITVGPSSELRPAKAKGFIFQADRAHVDRKGGSVAWLAAS